jgi:tRNA nucleotidyltransferase (CCA-adding enzyme)
MGSEWMLRDMVTRCGGKLYKVGGCVRDTFMEKEINDTDYMVTGLTEERAKKLFGESVGQSFPVFLFDVDGEKCEVALARKERSTGDGYNDFEVDVENVTIEEDLFRRDLTMNAIADDGFRLIDPYNGVKDIIEKTLRHVSEAFAEDPLRVYRVARFSAQMGFDVAPETKALCASMKSMLPALPGFRVFKELNKVMKSKYPSRFFDFLKEVDLLDVHFPEISALNVPDKHDGTAYRHVMNLLDRAQGRFPLKIMYGLLMHDLGKGVTPADQHPSHHQHEILGEPLAKKFGKRLQMDSNLINFGARCSLYHLVMRKVQEMKPGKVLKYFGMNDSEDLSLVSYLDAVYRDGADSKVETEIYNEMKRALALVQEVKNEYTGNHLIETGKVPGKTVTGKQFGEILDMKRIELLKERLRCQD